MSGGVFEYHEMYIKEIAECIRNIYVKQKDKKWVTWAQNEDMNFTPHTKEVLTVYKKAYKAMRIAHIYAKAVDYLEAGDYSDDVFLSKVNTQLKNLNIELNSGLENIDGSEISHDGYELPRIYWENSNDA
jgi:hypothetical protein